MKEFAGGSTCSKHTETCLGQQLRCTNNSTNSITPDFISFPAMHYDNTFFLFDCTLVIKSAKLYCQLLFFFLFNTHCFILHIWVLLHKTFTGVLFPMVKSMVKLCLPEFFTFLPKFFSPGKVSCNRPMIASCF